MIQVKPHQNIKPYLAEWRRGLSTRAEERSRLFKQYWDELVAAVQAGKDGVPDGSIREDREEGPPIYWYGVDGGALAGLWVRPVRGGLFTSTVEVIVVEWVVSPGQPG